MVVAVGQQSLPVVLLEALLSVAAAEEEVEEVEEEEGEGRIGGR